MLQLDDLPSGLPIEDISRNRLTKLDPIVQQMIIAQSEMQRFHEPELQRHEAMVQLLMQKISEMIQEDQGSTMRVEELDRQHNMLQAAMAHMNQVRQGSKRECEVAMMRVEEASQDRHVRDHELAESLSTQLGRLRREAIGSYLHLEARAQGVGLNMAREYEKLRNELNDKTRDISGRATLLPRSPYLKWQIGWSWSKMRNALLGPRSDARMEVRTAKVDKYCAE